jgi:hypothetical protein
MTKVSLVASKSAVILLFVCGLMPAATVSPDLSRYRNVLFGTDLPTVAEQVGANSSKARVVHSLPALIQQLAWRPRGLGPSAGAESVDNVIFSFYNGELYPIAVNYDRYQIEGLTAEDMVDAISTVYGTAGKPVAPVKGGPDCYGNQEDIIARWQDPQYSFDLIRSSYGADFTLIGVLKRFDSPAQAAIMEAKRLDDEEAPQRNAARPASEQEAARAKLEKAGLENKQRFRP